MKAMILADPSSAHTIKWVNALSKKGVDIFLYGLTEYKPQNYFSLKDVRIYSEELDSAIFAKKEGSFFKAVYLKQLKNLKMFVNEYKPDIIHSHYASSYGLLGAWTGFHPYIISVWGSDVYNFPNQSFVHGALFRYILGRADKILSTSVVMANETKKYTNKEVDVTPFGIDLNQFYPRQVESPFAPGDIVIGTVKSLEKKYGVEYLIKAFKIVKKKHGELPLKLLIVGGGSQMEYLKKLVDDLGLSNDTLFTGIINYTNVSRFQNILDIYVSLSVENSESFGVAVLEACACEKPVVVSDAGGLPEIVENNVTGFIVRKENPAEAADAIEKLVLDEELRAYLGKKGRERVNTLYNLNNNADKMLTIYNDVLSRKVLV
jgi:glycosyltransferase involved in cell wall biosynthesis